MKRFLTLTGLERDCVIKVDPKVISAMAGPFTDGKVVFTELFTMIRGVRCLRVVESPEAIELLLQEQEEKEVAKP